MASSVLSIDVVVDVTDAFVVAVVLDNDCVAVVVGLQLLLRIVDSVAHWEAKYPMSKESSPEADGRPVRLHKLLE